MTAIPYTDRHVKRLRDALLTAKIKQNIDVKHGHLSEALAAALGHRTHAALIADLASEATKPIPSIRMLDPFRFQERLAKLNQRDGFGKIDQWFFEGFGLPIDYWVTAIDDRDIAEDIPHPIYNGNCSKPAFPDIEGITLIRTRQREINLRTGEPKKPAAADTRTKRAWRNMIVSAINVALERGYFTLLPGTNRWPGYDPENRRKPFFFEFTFDGELPAMAAIHDSGFDEIAVLAYVNPKPTLKSAHQESPYDTMNTRHCDAWAKCFSLERRHGAYIPHIIPSNFSCKRGGLLDRLAAPHIKAAHYGDGQDVVW